MSVNWQQAPVDDRGLAFGDGCFETLRLHQGKAPFWAHHKRRLLKGLTRLGISACSNTLDDILQQALTRSPSGVLKIIVTRGAGGRGYNGRHLSQPCYYPRVFPLQLLDERLYRQGMVVGESTVALASQPLLAGIKHLNRLEQVLARHEAVIQGWDEALLRNQAGEPVELTAMNVFIRAENVWWTSALQYSGVEGVARHWALAQLGEQVKTSGQIPFSAEHIIEAFGCNSIMGIVPIQRLGKRDIPVGEQTLSLQHQWNSLWHDEDSY